MKSLLVRAKCAALLSLLIVASAACGPATKPNVDGVPDLLVTESRQFQTAAGLFLAPEAGPRNATGTVEATYLFARLLDSRFSEVASERTKDRLYDAAQTTEAPTWGRLMAAAALKRAHDSRWAQFRGVANSAFEAMPTTVQRAELGTYIAMMDPITMLVSPSPTAKLEIFDARVGNEFDEKDALAALNRSYLFANQDEIERSFARIQGQLVPWVQSEKTAVPKFIAAADALSVAAEVSMTDGVRQRVGAGIARLRGCRRASLFLPVSRDPGAPCSITMTEAARGIDGSMTAGGH